jgi:autotransporter-associated beta strand protein
VQTKEADRFKQTVPGDNKKHQKNKTMNANQTQSSANQFPTSRPEKKPATRKFPGGGQRCWRCAIFILALMLCALLTPRAGAASAVVSTNIWVGGGGDAFFGTGANWSPSAPGASGLALLTNSGATAFPGTNGMGHVATPNIIVNSDTRIGQLSFQNTNQLQGGYHTLEISNNVTLTVSNTVGTVQGEMTNLLSVGMGGTSTPQFVNDYGANLGIYSTIQGNGSLELICTNTLNANRGNVGIIQGSAGGVSDNDGMNATLDLSGLNTFRAAVNRIHVGSDTASGFFFKRGKGTLYLAKTNVLQLWANGNSPQGATYTHGLMVGAIANNGYVFRVSKVFLGISNAILTDAGVGVALRRVSATLAFNPSNTVPSSAFFRGLAGGSTRQALWSVADCRGSSPDSYDMTGIMDFSRGTIDAMVTTLNVGRGPTATTGGAIGTLTFNSGTLDVNVANIGVQQTSNIRGGFGTVNVGSNATMIVNNSLTLGATAGTLVGGSVYAGVVNVSGGGQLNVANTATVTCGTGSSNSITVADSTLKVPGIASAATPITLLRLTNSAVTLDLGANPNPATAVCTANNLETGPGIALTLLGTALTPGTITVFKYTTGWAVGSFTDFATFAHPGTGGYLSNDVANTSIVYVITNSTATLLTWNGQTNLVNTSSWDVNTTPAWKNGLVAANYANGNLVQFDDTAAGSGAVNLTTTLTPAFTTVSNSTKTYTFTGTGALLGAGGLTKTGNGTYILSNTGSNGFGGAITINDGTLRIAGSADRLPTSGAVTLANVATAALDLNNTNQTLASINGGGVTGGNITLGSGILSITGAGSYGGIISGTGSLFKKTAGTLTLTGANTYSGGTVISNGAILVANSTDSGLGSGSVTIQGGILQIGDGSVNGGVSATYITNNSNVSLFPASDITFTNIVVGSGNLSKVGGGSGTTIYITNANSFSGGTTINQGKVQISDSQALGSGTINVGNSIVSDTWLGLSGGITASNPITLSGKTGAFNPGVDHINNLSETNTLTGNIQLAGSTEFSIGADGGKLILTGNLVNNQTANPGLFSLRGAGDGNFKGAFNQGAGNSLALQKYEGGTWTLSGTNTYSGFTLISAGKLVVNGAINGSSKVSVGFGAALAGSGVIAAPVTNVGSLFPGEDSVVGTLTISNILTCDAAGTVTFDVGTNSNDKIRGLSQVNYAGTLKAVVNGMLSGNYIFKLFDAGAYVGTFDTFDLPDITPLSWDTSHLAVDGTLHATNGVPVTPVIATAGFVGSGFKLTGSGTTYAPYSILATTNLTIPIASWSNLGGGTFSNGVFNFTDLTATNYPLRFYLLSTPVP